jgi:hypothetical protein
VDRVTGRGVIAVLIGAVIALVVGASFGRANVQNAEVYPRSGVVTSIGRDEDVVEWTDGAGLVWSFNGCEDWMVGDGVSAIMNDMGTNEVYDDIIVSICYAG